MCPDCMSNPCECEQEETYTHRTKFGFHKRVKITELDREGLVTEINITKTGFRFLVRYFDKAEMNTVWFITEELERIR